MISETEIPLSKIYHPTAEEFADFGQFFENIDHAKIYQQYGGIKIVPPAKWKARKTPVSSEFDNLVVSAPIEQNVQGKSGIYELLLIQKKSMKLPEYKKKVEGFDALTSKKSVEEVEDMFWKNIAFSPPLYGADMAGSVFDSNVPWNLRDLPGVLSEGLKAPISGVNTPYLYMGSWKTMFGWHKEDLDLYSINYLHYGRPKFWYCLPASEGPKLEQFARAHFPEGFNKCKEFLRHKTIMIHPYILKQKIPDLKIHKIVQNPGEFVVTFGGAYHAGFNWGFNIAEAVNFATTKWLEILPSVSSCTCINDSVKIDKAQFYANLLTSPTYGKNPAIRKICLEHGPSSKLKTGSPKTDMDEIESTETADSHDANVSKRSQRVVSKGRMGAFILSEEEKVPSRKRVTAVKRGRGAPKKIKVPEIYEEGDEPAVQKLSKRSKKIKKLDDDLEAPDEKKVRKTRAGRIIIPSRNYKMIPDKYQ